MINHDIKTLGNFVLQVPVNSNNLKPNNINKFSEEVINYHFKPITDLKIVNINKWKINTKIAVNFLNKRFDNKLI